MPNVKTRIADNARLFMIHSRKLAATNSLSDVGSMLLDRGYGAY